jgi:type IX secretion system PorP/SprF family membrane protein
MVMIKNLSQIILFIIILGAHVSGQETNYSPGYQTIIMTNPAFTGSEGDGMLRLSYFNFYPGNNYDLHSVFLSYDTYMSVLHGGAGFYITDDYLGGIVNDLRGGFSYAYHLRAGEGTFINVGLESSFYHRGFNHNNIRLPDQIDPLNGFVFPSGEIIADRGRTVFDVSTGFLIISDRIYGGFSVNHLAEPDLSGSGSSIEKIKRKFSVQIAGNFDLSKNFNLAARPVLSAEIQNGHFIGGIGGAIENNAFSVNSVLIGNNTGSADIQTGISIKKGIILVFYNYRFNIVTGNKLLPLSLLHQTGVVFGLNNVDKRKTIKTINFPKL